MSANSTSDFISSRQLGDATITLINEGTLDWAPHFLAPAAEVRAAIPEADAEGRLTLGLHVIHVKLGDASILLDPGCDDPGSAWSAAFAGHYDNVTRTPGLAAALKQLGIAPEEITHVVITHRHGDHIAGLAIEQNGRDVPRYPNARHFFGRVDWEEKPPEWDPEPDLERNVGTVERAGLLELVDHDVEIAPGVTVFPAPGETAGHLAVRVDSNGNRFFYVGDLFHHAAEVAHLDWISPGRDKAAMLSSRQRVIDESLPSGATCVYTHHPFPGWGHFETAGDHYRWVQG